MLHGPFGSDEFCFLMTGLIALTKAQFNDGLSKEDVYFCHI